MVETVTNHNSTEAQGQKEPVTSPHPVQMKQRRSTQRPMPTRTRGSLQPAPPAQSPHSITALRRRCDEARWSSESSCSSLPCSEDDRKAPVRPFRGRCSSLGGGSPEGRSGRWAVGELLPRTQSSPPQCRAACTRRARVKASTPGLAAAQDTRKSSTMFSQYSTREMPPLCTWRSG